MFQHGARPVALSEVLTQMAKFGATLRNVFVWTYSRGTIPYDIICALIILFIFLTPRSCFVRKPAVPEPHSHVNQESSGAALAALHGTAGEPAQRYSN
jgi:hypothetical protein